MDPRILFFVAALAICPLAYVLCPWPADVSHLEIGDCVKISGGRSTSSLDTVDCDEDGAYKINNRVQIKGFDEYPGRTAIVEYSGNRCPRDSVFYYFPTERDWNAPDEDDRYMLCFDKP